MFVERKELVMEIRELRAHIESEIKIVNGNLKDILNDVNNLRNLIELLNQRMGQLEHNV